MAAIKGKVALHLTCGDVTLASQDIQKEIGEIKAVTLATTASIKINLDNMGVKDAPVAIIKINEGKQAANQRRKEIFRMGTVKAGSRVALWENSKTSLVKPAANHALQGIQHPLKGKPVALFAPLDHTKTSKGNQGAVNVPLGSIMIIKVKLDASLALRVSINYPLVPPAVHNVLLVFTQVAHFRHNAINALLAIFRQQMEHQVAQCVPLECTPLKVQRDAHNVQLVPSPNRRVCQVANLVLLVLLLLDLV